jgi:hypothetical protein
MILFRQFTFSYFLLLFLFLTLSIIYYPSLSFSQSNDSPKFQVLNKNTDIRITFPYTASNHDRKNPSDYIFKEPILNDWNLFINNNISYSTSPEAKTVIQFKEPYPSEKFIELTMFGDKSKKFSIAVNTKESGRLQVYQNNFDGWSLDNPVVVTSGVDQGISITNGKRIVVDKLSLNGFNLGSINVYGKDEPQFPNSTLKGSIQFEAIFGHPAQSYIYYMPLIVLVGVGGIVIFLLKTKKRDR